LFFNYGVALDATHPEQRGAGEHPLVAWSFAPDNKREEQTSPMENKFSFGDVAHPHPVKLKDKSYCATIIK
jgi:hypothetical protein